MTAKQNLPGHSYYRTLRFGVAAALFAALAACSLRPSAVCVDSGGIGASPSLIFCGDKYSAFERDSKRGR